MNTKKINQITQELRPRIQSIIDNSTDIYKELSNSTNVNVTNNRLMSYLWEEKVWKNNGYAFISNTYDKSTPHLSKLVPTTTGNVFSQSLTTAYNDKLNIRIRKPIVKTCAPEINLSSNGKLIEIENNLRILTSKSVHNNYIHSQFITSENSIKTIEPFNSNVTRAENFKNALQNMFHYNDMIFLFNLQFNPSVLIFNPQIGNLALKPFRDEFTSNKLGSVYKNAIGNYLDAIAHINLSDEYSFYQDDVSIIVSTACNRSNNISIKTEADNTTTIKLEGLNSLTTTPKYILTPGSTSLDINETYNN